MSYTIAGAGSADIMTSLAGLAVSVADGVSKTKDDLKGMNPLAMGKIIKSVTDSASSLKSNIDIMTKEIKEL